MTGKTTYTYGPYTSRFRDDVLELQTLLWSKNRTINADYLTWKYEQNPFLKDVHIALAMHEDSVIGMRGAWGSSWRIEPGGQTVVVPCLGDTVISPDHRGKGVLRGLNHALLSTLADNDFAMVFNLSASKPVFFGSIKDGWNPLVTYRELTRMHPLFRIRRARKLRDRFLLSRWRRTRRISSNIARIQPQITTAPDIEVRATPRIDAMDRLVRQLEKPEVLGPVRDKEYYSWRFLCPLSHYIFIYSGQDELNGFMVLQFAREKERGVSIIDWEAVDESVFRQLIEVACRFARSRDLKIWSQSVPGAFRSVLDALRFSETIHHPTDDYPRSLLAKELWRGDADMATPSVPAEELDKHSWNLRMICSDDY